MRYLTAYLNVTLLTALSTVCWGAAIDDCMVQGKNSLPPAIIWPRRTRSPAV